MKNKNLFEDNELNKKLGERLSNLSNVSQYDSKDNKEGFTIIYSLSELEDSCSKLREEILPRLIKENLTDSEIEDILHEIGEEFRHILYHIKDMKYYGYLFHKKES